MYKNKFIKICLFHCNNDDGIINFSSLFQELKASSGTYCKCVSSGNLIICKLWQHENADSPI